MKPSNTCPMCGHGTVHVQASPECIFANGSGEWIVSCAGCGHYDIYRGTEQEAVEAYIAQREEFNLAMGREVTP